MKISYHTCTSRMENPTYAASHHWLHWIIKTTICETDPSLESHSNRNMRGAIKLQLSLLNWRSALWLKKWNYLQMGKYIYRPTCIALTHSLSKDPSLEFMLLSTINFHWCMFVVEVRKWLPVSMENSLMMR